MRSIETFKRLLWNRELDRPLLYQPLEHPAFEIWGAQQPCVERWRMIRQALPLSTPGRCLDLGCNTGWFCRAFSRFGWQAIGFDKDPLAIEVASELMRPWNGDPSPEYRLGDLTKTILPPADVALCLSLIMYIFPLPGWELLGRVSSAVPVMFLDYGGKYSDHLAFTPETLGDDIVAHTDYVTCERLGSTHLESRPFYICRSNAPLDFRRNRRGQKDLHPA